MKVRVIVFQLFPRGWRCTVTFTFSTARQFTDEAHTVAAFGRWRWLAEWRARGVARRHVARRGAKPGERAAKGWAE